MARKRVLTGGEKLNLALGLVSFLSEHNYSSISELAKQFGVDAKDVQSALKMVWLIERNGDSLFDFDFDLDEMEEVALGFRQAFDGMPKLSSLQIVALQAGLTKLASLPGVADRQEIEALTKLLGQQISEAAPQTIHITPGTVDAETRIVTEAIVSRKRISFEYTSVTGETSVREVDPVQLTSVGEDWIVRGYCHGKKSERNFRVDRMRGTSMLDLPISEEALKLEISQFVYKPTDHDTLVSFEVEPEALKLMDDFIQDSEPTELANGSFRFDAPIGDLSALGPVVARYGGHAKVVAPKEAVAAVASYARATLAQFSAEPQALNEE